MNSGQPSAFLFRVKETFTFRPEGLIILSEPGVNSVRITIKLGDSVELRTPTGTSLRTRVTGIEIACPNPDRYQSIMVPNEIKPSDVPPGTEVWQV